MSDQFAISFELRDAASAAGLELLRTELRVANTMMDLIASSLSEDARGRRLQQAQDACDVVASHLGRNEKHFIISESHRCELASGLSLVRARMQRL